MPNRVLREGALDSEHLGAIDEGSELLFYKLLNIVDDYGRYDGRVSVIRARAFPLRLDPDKPGFISESETDRRLNELARPVKIDGEKGPFGLIGRYEVAGKPYIVVHNFRQRQRAEISRFPEPPSKWQTGDGHPQASRARAQGVGVDVGVDVDVKTFPGARAKTARPGEKKINGASKHVPETADTWTAYAKAYTDRWGTAPLRSAHINSLVKKFVERVPLADAPHVAAFFCQSQKALYVNSHHAVQLLVRDANALHTEWVTGKQLTQTEARQQDQTAARGNVWGGVLEKTGGSSDAKS